MGKRKGFAPTQKWPHDLWTPMLVYKPLAVTVM